MAATTHVGKKLTGRHRVILRLKFPLLLTLACCLVAGCNRQNGPAPGEPDPQSANCAGRLKMLDDAKATWAQQNGKSTNDTPTMDELLVLLRGKPECPGGGTYTMTPVGSLSTCSKPEHTAYYQKSLTEKKTE
jgi:hypothetical protein